MHEEAVLKDLVRRTESVAREQRAVRVTRARVRIGALSHLTATTLRERWPMATRGTVAEGSVVEVETTSDITDPRARDVVLTSVDVADGAAIDLADGELRPGSGGIDKSVPARR